MEQNFFMPTQIVAAKNHTQQMKVLVNLPVRLIAEGQTVDIVPLEGAKVLGNRRNRPNLNKQDTYVAPPNELIDFFGQYDHDELMNTEMVAAYYGIAKSSVRRWARKGYIKKIKLDVFLTFYEVKNLPSLQTILDI